VNYERLKPIFHKKREMEKFHYTFALERDGTLDSETQEKAANSKEYSKKKRK
jgi:hypothetical protein